MNPGFCEDLKVSKHSRYNLQHNNIIIIQRKKLQDSFLARFDQILKENYLTMFSCKIIARFFISCKKSFIFIFSARLARYVQDLVKDPASLARKILARFACFLQDRFYCVYSISYTDLQDFSFKICRDFKIFSSMYQISSELRCPLQ